MKTIDAARNRWSAILINLGVDESFLKNKHGPCPVCGGKDRFRYDDRNGNGEWICNHCGNGNGFNLLMNLKGWNFGEAAKQVDSVISNCQEIKPKAAPKKDPRQRLKKVQQGLLSCEGINPVSIYLKNRGLPKSKYLKYHPKQAYYENGGYQGTFPCMVAVFSSPTGQPLTFHVTHLTKHGTKAEVSAPKKVLPPVSELAGGAIRLFDPARIMGIAEGIETALACFKLFGIPTWASYSAVLLEKFEPPEECEHLVIFADNDKSFTGQKAAYALANRLAIKGIDAEVRVTDTPGQDWADKAEATQ